VIIIVFDDECVLCNGWVLFILSRDRQRHLKFTSAKSSFGSGLLRAHGYAPGDLETMLLIKDNKAYIKSEAVIEAFAAIGWPWKCVLLVRIVPRVLRDYVYSVTARNRYVIAGRAKQCAIPSTYRDRFIL